MVALILLLPSHVHSQDTAQPLPTDHPLAPFERLVGGEWHLDGSYQVFEWGVGRHSVRSRSYDLLDGVPRLLAEGMWYWHPGEETIRGVFTAIEMPAVLFDYTTTFQENKMVNRLRTYGVAGGEQAYLETWDFTDDSSFVWKLLVETAEGVQEVMKGTYTRKN
jgi:hypothetical protein